MSKYLFDIKNRAEIAREWLFEAAFPFWADNSVHPENGFYEALDLEGRPLDSEVSRVRVQARQIYCFSLAKLNGWNADQSRKLIDHGLYALQVHCRTEESLYGRLMSHTGGMTDSTVDLYDSAFAMLSFAAAASAGHQTAEIGLVQVSRAIDALLKRPGEVSGYYEELPPPVTRNQNPHMHTYEASLAAFAASGDASHMRRAIDIEKLLSKRFWDTEYKGLRERFSSDWGRHDLDHFEAGHQYEWAWLLSLRARLTGAPISGLADSLYAKALDLTQSDNAVLLEHNLDGTVRNGTQRCWGLTEALKAHMARFELGDNLATKRVVETFDRLWDLHIQPAKSGGWLDEYDQKGKLVSHSMPASTGYHIFLAYFELIRVSKMM